MRFMARAVALATTFAPMAFTTLDVLRLHLVIRSAIEFLFRP